MKQTFLILIFSAINTAVLAQMDTVFLEIHDSINSHSRQYSSITGHNDFLYNEAFSSKVRPYSDVLYSTKDSVLFSGIVKLTNYSIASDSTKYKSDWSYYVENGKTSLMIGHVNGILRDSIIVNNDEERFVSIGIKRKIREILNEKNGKLNGYQYNVVFDSLKLESIYINDTLVDFLNKDIIFVCRNSIVLSEVEFFKKVGTYKYGNWDLAILTRKESTLFRNYRIIMYQVGISKEFDPENKRDRKKVLKQLPTITKHTNCR